MTRRPEPLRYQVCRDWIETSKAEGDAAALASARRIYNEMTGMGRATDADRRAWAAFRGLVTAYNGAGDLVEMSIPRA